MKIERECEECGALCLDDDGNLTPVENGIIEQQAARIAELDTKCRLYEASLDKSDRRIAELEARSAMPVAWECASPEGERPALAFLTSKKPTVEHYENQGWRVTPLYLATPVADSAMHSELSTETVDKPVHSGANSAMAKDAERLNILEVKLRVERAKVERCVQILSAIHGLLNPQDVSLDDGRIMRFSNPDFQIECYRQLSERIRAIPESLDSAIAASADDKKSPEPQ
ncbi:hypothetical protein [Paraburkholderia hospita]|uniref:hypothetical protein n=1 Tax=Paraburkholderia hospita TaxID=169430 RepID=UPI003ED0B021